MPNFIPIANDYDTPIISIARAMLLQSFAIWPAPDFWQLKKLFPIPERIAWHL